MSWGQVMPRVSQSCGDSGDIEVFTIEDGWIHLRIKVPAHKCPILLECSDEGDHEKLKQCLRSFHEDVMVIHEVSMTAAQFEAWRLAVNYVCSVGRLSEDLADRMGEPK